MLQIGPLYRLCMAHYSGYVLAFRLVWAFPIWIHYCAMYTVSTIDKVIMLTMVNTTMNIMTIAIYLTLHTDIDKAA